MNAPSLHTAHPVATPATPQKEGGRREGTPDAAERDRLLHDLDLFALRTAARARCRIRAAVHRGEVTQAGPPSGAGGFPEGPFEPGPGPAGPTQVALLPGLPGWLGPVLATMSGSATVLRPEYDADGQPRDYTVLGANHFELAGPDGAERFLGRPLSQVRPGARTSGMYDLYRAALTEGGPVSTDGIDYVDLVDGAIRRARLRGTVTPLPDEGLLLTHWEPIGEGRISRRIQESSRMGWAEWDLITGKIQWSRGLSDLLGLREPPIDDGAHGDAAASGDAAARGDEAARGGPASDHGSAPGRGAAAQEDAAGVQDGGPLAPTVTTARDLAVDLHVLGRMIDPADLPGFVRDVRALLRGEEAPDREVTMWLDGEERRIRWIGYAHPTGAGPPETLLLAARDITEQDRLLRTARSDAERSRQEAAAERRISETLRKALIPPLPALTPPWMSVSVAYVPSDQRIGGDWYKCRELPDGRVLIAVGDASGHGVDAASRAVQQRSALAGLAYTDGDPAQLATALGEVVYHGGLDTTATAVIGHLDPAAREFRWASAGHPSPILVRDDVPHVLEAEHGMLLGVAPEGTYPVNTTRLESGDLLLLYTDGVIERRGHDLDTGVAALLRALTSCAAGGDEARAVTDCLTATLLGPEAEDDATMLAVRVT